MAATLFCACGRVPQPCTMEYKEILVTVKHNNGAPARLDTTFTVRQSIRDTFSFSRYDTLQGLNAQGEYVLMGDRNNIGKKESFTFYGIARGDTVVSEPYTFDFSGCHVQLVSGNTNVFIP